MTVGNLSGDPLACSVGDRSTLLIKGGPMDDQVASFDWQHPRVLSELSRTLVELPSFRSWLDAAGRVHLGDRNSADIEQALRYCGEKIDSYQMARFLEDSRSWPSNEGLCELLGASRVERTKLIKKFENELRPKPAKKQGIPLGAILKAQGEDWQVIGISHADTPEESHYLLEQKTGSSAGRQVNCTGLMLKTYYPNFWWTYDLS